MDPTEPRDPSGRSPGWAGLGAILVLGAVNKAVRRVTADDDGDRDGGDEHAPPPPPAPARHRLRWVGLGLAVALVVAGLAVVVARSGDDGSPSHWDPRVATFARFVEHERGLRFEHPVRTDFLADDAFRRRVTGDDEPTAEDQATLHHYEGLFRALGLVEGKVDLGEATKQLAGEGIIGLYVPSEDRIYVRGDRITPGMRPTIVHELTHALQAQHFDLERETTTSGEDTAFTSLVEADAMRIEDAYVASLPDAERTAVEADEQRQTEQADFDGVPQILTELFALPYVFGPTFVDALVADGGNDAVDRAFRHPPTTEEHIVDPRSYLDGDHPSKVAAPKLRSGEKAAGDADDFGMLSLLLVLGERLSFPDAWQAVDGWKGDASRDYRRGGRDCIRVRTQVDTPEDATQLLGALRVWATDRTDADTSSAGDVVTFSSCDPGTTTATNDPSRPRTFEVLQLRVEVLASLEENGLGHAQAECVVDDVLRDHPARQLLDVGAISDPKDERIVQIQRDVAESEQACRTTA
ncbi:MAG: hypothetical protein JWN67_4089 [Actinomycetia bacterium]|nr:hypothetical protein [Actinomycetes bacterium]